MKRRLVCAPAVIALALMTAAVAATDTSWLQVEPEKVT